MAWFNMHDAKTRLSQLVAKAQAGEDVVISRDGKPVARLVRIEPSAQRASLFGSMKGKIWIAPDFDAPIAELEDSFYDAAFTTSEPLRPKRAGKRQRTATSPARSRRRGRAA